MQQNSFNLCSDTENVHQIYIQLLNTFVGLYKLLFIDILFSFYFSC